MEVPCRTAGTGIEASRLARLDGPRSSSRSARLVALALAAAVALLAAACGSSTSETAVGGSEISSTSSSSATTAPPVPTAPLTGIPISAAEEARLQRPALVVKIDNDVLAMPQAGLNQADIVIEEPVWEKSRFAAIFHSQDIERVGPIRSARTHDAELLPMLGHPLVAWSGGNEGVTEIMYEADVHNVNHDLVAFEDYYRDSTRPAPHNLYSTGSVLRGYATPEDTPPAPQFQYYAPGDDLPGTATPAAGLTLDFGTEDGEPMWVWAADRNTWVRYQDGGPHVDETGAQLSAVNVVSVEVTTIPGPADARDPHAITTGTGAVAVFSQGHVIYGLWARSDAHHPFTLTDYEGNPIMLTPGNTYLAITPVDGTALMDEGTAASVLATGRTP
ncbi:MAG: hypothetical protein JJLCMIEE_00070 [Acidimicrobiales bacterium]|nr:hypothetical protein [Acidimicrobiales bacterium]